MMRKIIILSFIGLFLWSCDGIKFNSSPHKVFSAIGLNSNTVNGDFSRLFKEVNGRADVDQLFIVKNDALVNTYSYEEYFQNTFADYFGRYIESVEQLKPTDETQEMIDLALVMFNRAHEVYSRELAPIGKMMDEKRPQAEIDRAINELSSTKGIELENLRADVLDLVMPYAEKHGIEVKFSPSFK